MSEKTMVENDLREKIAREVRLAMLDNPTDDSFKLRWELRKARAESAADEILELVRAALTADAPPDAR